MSSQLLGYLIFFAGLAQIALVVGSAAIPKLLNWKGELMKTSLLIRQIFWTYAGYILVINFSFGLLSILGEEELLDKSFLAKAITLFIALYWITRILIQFFYFDTSAAPKGLIYKVGEVTLVLLFFFLAIIYSCAFIYNL